MGEKTLRIWEGVDQSKTKSMWGGQSIANINSIIGNNFGGIYEITSAQLNVYADFDGAGGLANVYMKYGFGSTRSISTQLGGVRKLTKDNTNYPNDITAYLSSDKKGISTNYGNYFVANVYTSNVVVGSSGALHISNVDIVLKYNLYYTVTAKCKVGDEFNSNAGTVTGQGTYLEGSTVTFTAKANDGYRFVMWDNGSTDPTITFIADRSLLYFAYFEVDKINKIYIGTSQPKKIYIGTQEVKAVYVGTTKVYG